MDTISRENNSMLPVGGIIVGIIGLLLGGIALVQVSKANKALEAHSEKIAKIDNVEMQVGTAASAADQAKKDVVALRNSVQDGFNTVAGELANQRAAITKMEQAAIKPVAAPTAGKKGGEPAVAGPGEYVVKAGDYGTKIAKANGVALKDLQTVNPSVNWKSLKPGVKLKLPKK